MKHRKRERERERNKELETQRDTGIHRDTQRYTKRHKKIETERCVLFSQRTMKTKILKDFFVFFSFKKGSQQNFPI